MIYGRSSKDGYEFSCASEVPSQLCRIRFVAQPEPAGQSRRVGFQATDQEPATLQRGLVPRNLPGLLDNAGEDGVLDVRAFYENNPAWVPLTG